MIFRRSLLVFPAVLLLAAFPASSQSAKFGAVSVAGIKLSGLTSQEATRRLRRQLAPKLKARVGLAAGTRVVYRRRGDLGFSLDIGKMLGLAAKKPKSVPLYFRVDQKSAAKALGHLSKRFASQSRDAKPVLVGQKVRIRPEIVEKRLDVSTSAARLKKWAETDASKTRFALVSRQSSPTLTRARLKGINAILGRFTTRFNPGKVKRTRNMRIAIGSIDGTLLSPNEVFSLNDTVGERTQARGYRTAVIFENGKKEPGLGGGVSQVTGTLFNSALVSGLPIVTYRVHSRPVAYLPLGRDATVSWGNFDMKFKNDTGAPIYISYQLRGSRVTATLFGRRTGKRATMRVVSRKKGERDIAAVLYRTIRKNGKVVKKERVGTSRYNWKDDNED